MLTKGDLSAIQGLIKTETQGVEERLGKKIENLQESVDIIQSVVVDHYGKLDERVTQIEEHLNPPNSS